MHKHEKLRFLGYIRYNPSLEVYYDEHLGYTKKPSIKAFFPRKKYFPGWINISVWKK